MSAALELQTAIYDVLAADVPLSAAVTGVYDDVPSNELGFPYVTLGEDVLAQWDTDQTEGFSGSVTVHVWSQADGQAECKTVQGLIYAALHRVALTLTNYNCILIQQTEQTSSRDPDGVTRHGVQTFSFILGAI